MSDVYLVSKKIIDLFTEAELSKAQALFALKAAEVSINEEITREIIADSKRGHDSHSGVM